MKYLKLLSKVSIVLSILLSALGVWSFVDGEYLMGFALIGLGFAISINDWINLFKKK